MSSVTSLFSKKLIESLAKYIMGACTSSPKESEPTIQKKQAVSADHQETQETTPQHDDGTNPNGVTLTPATSEQNSFSNNSEPKSRSPSIMTHEKLAEYINDEQRPKKYSKHFTFQ